MIQNPEVGTIFKCVSSGVSLEMLAGDCTRIKVDGIQILRDGAVLNQKEVKALLNLIMLRDALLSYNRGPQ